MRKITINLLVSMLLISLVLTAPEHSLAETQGEIETQEVVDAQEEIETQKLEGTQVEITLISEGEEILLYETPSEEKWITEIPNNTKVILLESNEDDYSYIQYKNMDVNQEEGEILEGFVKNIYIATEEELNQEPLIEEKSEQTEPEKVEESEQETVENVDEAEPELLEEKEENIEQEEIDVVTGEETSEELKVETPKRDESKSATTEIKASKQQKVALMNLKTYRGITLKAKTYIRTEPATTSKPLKTFPIDTVLEIQPYNDNWYTLAKEINGQIGYIHKKHLEKVIENQETLRGVALKSPTNVRLSPSTKVRIIHSYPIGSILEYKTFSTNWYEVSIGGQTGYIHKKHVENAVAKQKSNIGITLKSPTNIRAAASTKAAVVDTLSIRSILEYKTFSTYWV
ncbi:hypothetical protein ACA29_22745 [Lederbergia galactosidilytica]|uniref:SH3b domain-containing protein n=1 Tax=Lederbergia galactosidilytica TaxID=217031 RepID=A0A0Q9XVW1_9BACI|nr:hypothetical protein ACA29_22745 [Lederbergia galactosidilytica]